MTEKILVLTKQLKIFIKLNEELAAQSFSIFNVTTAESAAQAIVDQDFSAVIIDLDCLGIPATKQLIANNRSLINGPIIVLSPEPSEQQLLDFFSQQIDDYLAVDGSLIELIARLRQRIWAYRSTRSPQRKIRNEVKVATSAIHLDDLTIDLAHYQVRRQDTDLGLTPKEFKLLMYLIDHNGQVLNREQILTQVWGYDELESSRIVDIHISHLRDKIELDSKDPQIIKTVRGFGYIFEDKNLKIGYQN